MDNLPLIAMVNVAPLNSSDSLHVDYNAKFYKRTRIDCNAMLISTQPSPTKLAFEMPKLDNPRRFKTANFDNRSFREPDCVVELDNQSSSR